MKKQQLLIISYKCTNTGETPRGGNSCEPYTDISSISIFFTCGSWPRLIDEAAVCYVELAQRCTHTHTHAALTLFDLLITITALCLFYIVQD